MPEPFQRVYSDAERAAVAHAYRPRICSASRVCELASAGELKMPDGNALEAFTIRPATVRGIARDQRRRDLAEQSRTPIADVDARDAVETLRVGLLEVAQRELQHVRKQKAGEVDAERLRQLARVLRELQAIPGRDEGRLPAPGAKANGRRQGGELRTGLGSDLVRAHRATFGRAAPPEPRSEAAPEPAPPEPEPEPVDRLRAAGERLAQRMQERLAPLVEQPPDPAPMPRPAPATWQSTQHPGEVPPGTKRDAVRYDRMPDEDTSAGLGRR